MFCCNFKRSCQGYANASEPTCTVQPFLHVLHVEVMLFFVGEIFITTHVQLTKRFGMLHYIVWLQMF